MKIEYPFNYINILVFSILLKYENKRSIDIDTLKKYHEMLLDEVIKIYESKSESCEQDYFLEEDKWKGKLEFVTNKKDSLDNFLYEFSHLFYKVGDIIYLYDEVNYDDIIKEEVRLREDENISNRFSSASDSNRLFSLLNINKIKNVLEKYIKLEHEIEENYCKFSYNSSNDEIKEKLKKLLFMRAIFLNNLCQNQEYVIDAFRLESNRIYMQDSNYEYSKAPIDLDLWKKSKYFINSQEDIGDIDDRIYDIYQYAIFGKSSLVYIKTLEMLTNLYFHGDLQDNRCELTEDCFDIEDDLHDETIDEQFDDENTYYMVDTEEMDLIFYMNYLHKLDKYIEKYGVSTDLDETRNRLLYVLDMPKLCLFSEEKFIQTLEKYKNYKIYKDDYDFIKDEVRFMTDEVFMVENDINTVKKLLFISTYYELTHDEKIVKIWKKNLMNDRFALYSEIIFGEEKGYSRRLTKNN